MSIRAYIIPHFQDADGTTKVILGKESVVSGLAVWDLARTMEDPRAARQFTKIKRNVANGDSFLWPNGAPVERGPWRGRNFGGILLIGRPAFAGGRVERGESLADGAARELVEEYKLSPGLLAPGRRQRITRHLRRLQVVEDRQRGRTETYYTLDLDAVRDAALLPSRILSGFRSEVVPVAEMWACDSKRDPRLRVEKRQLEVAPVGELAARFQGLAPDDEQHIRERVYELAACFCGKLGLPEAADGVASALMQHQRARDTQQLVAVAQQFARAAAAGTLASESPKVKTKK